MSIIYIYLYMHYMLKRRVEQWVCLCVCLCVCVWRGTGTGTGRERQRKSSAIGEQRASFTRSIYQAVAVAIRGVEVGGWLQGFFCSFLHFQLPDSIRFDYHLIILFISILLNSLFAASLWFLIFSSSSFSSFFSFSSSALSSSLCLAVVLVVVCCYHIQLLHFSSSHIVYKKNISHSIEN